MASETEYGNYIVQSSFISGSIIPVMEPLVWATPWATLQVLEGEAKTATFKKLGSLTASTVNESAQASKVEYTETSVNCTAVKSKVYSELSEESEIYIGSPALARLIEKSAMAIAQKDNVDFCTLFASFSGNSAGSTGTALSTDALLLAQFKLDEDDIAGDRAYFLHSKQFQEIADELKDANKPELFNNQAGFLARGGNLSVVRATLFGCPVYVSNNVTDDATDFSGALVSQYAIGKVYANGGLPVVTIADDPEYGKKKIGVSSFFGYVEILDNAGCKLVSGV